MYKIDQDRNVLFGNVQIQLYKFEPLESGNDSVDINLNGLDLSCRANKMASRYQQLDERIDHMDW